MRCPSLIIVHDMHLMVAGQLDILMQPTVQYRTLKEYTEEMNERG